MGITDDKALTEQDALEPGEGYRLGQLDGFKRQLPAPDPVETREWVAALDGVVFGDPRHDAAIVQFEPVRLRVDFQKLNIVGVADEVSRRAVQQIRQRGQRDGGGGQRQCGVQPERLHF